MDDAKSAAVVREYKLLKEAFVTGLNGGTIREINLVSLVASVRSPLLDLTNASLKQPCQTSVLLWSALQSRQSLFTPYTFLSFIADFLLNCAAILSVTTFYSSQPLVLNLLLLVPALITIAASTASPTTRHRGPRKEDANGRPGQSAEPGTDPFPVKPFVTTYRGTMMVITCVAILAVDFKVFPRRFAKVENWGTSLMDLGVGSFVFSAGTVAARPILKEQAAGGSTSIKARLRSAARHSTPLLVLGLVRLYTVKGLDYAEHVTEYGVHWNFFFTLAFLPPFVALFDSAFTVLLPSYAALAMVLAAAYEAVLDFTDLKVFILTAQRTDLLSKNREGIFSLFGYLAIFLAGQSTGMYILPRASKSGPLQNPIIKKLAIWSLVWSALTYLATDYRFGLGLQVSRRLANLPYVLWVSAFNTCQIGFFCLIETLLFPGVYNARTKAAEQEQAKRASSRILRTFNRNGLAIFLLANLMTGLINMTLPTLHMGDKEAVGVIVTYMGILSGVALLLDTLDVSIKL